MTQETFILETEHKDRVLGRGQEFIIKPAVEALTAALEYAKPPGYVLGIPDLIDGVAADPFQNEAWDNYWTGRTVEVLGRSPEGEKLWVTLHGAVTLARLAAAIPEGGLNFRTVLSYTQQEFNGLLEGRTPDGRPIKRYDITDLEDGAKIGRRAIVVSPFSRIEDSEWDVGDDGIADDALILSRCGSKAKVQKLSRLAWSRPLGYTITSTWNMRTFNVESPRGKLVQLAARAQDHELNLGQGRPEDQAAFVAATHDPKAQYYGYRP